MPFAPDLLFPQNTSYLEEYWPLMALINIWRIPILFVISGMGVYFAFQNRTVKKIIKDRAGRILVPFIFGYFVICPLQFICCLEFYNYPYPLWYYPMSSHLWFLLNIYVYFQGLIFVFLYFKKNQNNLFLNFFKNLLKYRFGIYVFIIPFILEALIVNPKHYSLYAETMHGWVLGVICFLIGYLLVSFKEHFWLSIDRIRFFALIIAILLYLQRISHIEFEYNNALIAIESFNWILVVFAFAARYLNKPSEKLSYLSAAVFPVYILHMPFQIAISLIVLPLNLPASLKLFILVLLTLFCSMAFYEYLIRRIKFLRPFFGVKY